MLTREQVYTMLILRQRGALFGGQANDINIIRLISDRGQDPNNDIHVALRLAASGIQTDMDVLVDMVRANPRLLLHAGNVITRGGVEVIRTGRVGCRIPIAGTCVPVAAGPCCPNEVPCTATQDEFKGRGAVSQRVGGTPDGCRIVQGYCCITHRSSSDRNP